jgi:hypothetical protein
LKSSHCIPRTNVDDDALVASQFADRLMTQDFERSVDLGELAPQSVQAVTTIPESPFDLIALERTRLALQMVGVGFLLRAIATIAWFDVPANLLSFASSLVLLVAMTVFSSSPNGPFSSGARGFFASVWSLDCISSIALLVFLSRTEIAGDLESFPFWVSFIIPLIGFAVLSLPVIFWHFCRQRGLEGLGRRWLWVAHGYTAPWIATLSYSVWSRMTSTTSAVYSPLVTGVFWIAIAVVHFCMFVMAWRTAREFWLDALTRHARLFAHAHPAAAVEPLHPADRH